MVNIKEIRSDDYSFGFCSANFKMGIRIDKSRSSGS